MNTYSQVSVWQILASGNVCLFLPLHLSVGTNSHLSTRILIGTKRRQKQGSTEGLYNQQQWGKGNRKAPVSSCLSAALYLGPTDHTWPQPSSSFLDPKEEEWTRAFLVPLGSDLLCNFLLSTRQNSFPCFPMKEHGSVSSFSQEKCKESVSRGASRGLDRILYPKLVRKHPRTSISTEIVGNWQSVNFLCSRLHHLQIADML